MGRPFGNHEEKRLEVAAAAQRVIALRGLSQTTLRDIADELACTTGVLRHYFRNKEELLKFTKDHIFDAINQSIVRSRDNKTGLERLAAMLLAALPFDADGRLHWQIYMSFMAGLGGDSEKTKAQGTRNMHTIKIIEREMRHLQRTGDLPSHLSPKTEAKAATCFIEGLGIHATIDANEFSARVMERLVHTYVERLAAARA